MIKINKQKKILIIMIVSISVCFLIIAGIFYFWQKNRGINNQFITDNHQADFLKEKITLSILKDFPFYINDNNVFTAPYFDSKDSNIIWFSFGGVIGKYDLKNNIWQPILTGVNGLDNRAFGMVKKGDDIFFSLFQRGFEKINIKTGNSKIYTTNDGLADNRNIKIYNDPDSDDIWLATFNGVSKFDTQKEKFTNYTRELGIGSWWGIDYLSITPDFIWAAVSANSFNPGSMARYDKKKDVWEFWGPETFNNQGRVDIVNGFDALNGNVIVNVNTTGNVLNNKIVEYNLRENQWHELFNSKNAGLPDNLTYLGERIYFNSSSSVFYYDRNEKIFSSTGFGSGMLYRDQNANKLMINQWPKQILVYDLNNNSAQKLNFGRSEDLFNGLIIADARRLVFSAVNSVTVFDSSTNENKKIAGLSSGEDMSGKLIGDSLVLFSPNSEGMDGCYPGKLYIVDLNKYSISQTATPQYCFDNIYVGKDLSEIFVTGKIYSFNNQKATGIQKYDNEKNIFLNLTSNIDLNKFDLVLSDIPRAVSKDGNNIVEVAYNNNNQSGIKVTYYDNTETVNPFDSLSINPQINTMTFDNSKTNYLWIGTDLGLFRYNIETKTINLLTKKSGLFSNDIKKIISISDMLIVGGNTGAYIYKINIQ